MNTASRNGGVESGPKERVREYEAWYRTLVERLPAIVYVDASDAVSYAIYMSPQAEVMLGYTQEEWTSDPALWVKILHPADRERVLAEASRTRETGDPFRMEYRLLARDGQIVWVRDEATLASGVAQGHPETWHGVMLDITERKKHEEELRRSEERYQLVAKATGEAIWDKDLLTGRQEWSGATKALFGYPAHKDTDGEWWEERIHPEDRARILSSLNAVLGSGEDVWSEEYRFRRADGSYATVVDRGYVVRDPSKREPVRMVGSMADVTESRRIEEALKDSERRFRTTFEAAAVGMAHVAPDGRWLRINDALCEISGYEREELLGMNFLDLTPPEELDASLDRISRMLEGQLGPYTLERRYIRKDGSRVWVSLSVSLVRESSGEPDYFVCVAKDITQRKVAELVPNPLTAREMEVLKEVVAGRSDPQISRTLTYSLGTVKRDVRRILGKLEARNRKGAAAKALEIGLASPPPY